MIEENIFRLNLSIKKYFNVAMKNVILAQIVNSVDYLHENFEGLCFGEFVVLGLEVE